jgi:hypothetical protein
MARDDRRAGGFARRARGPNRLGGASDRVEAEPARGWRGRARSCVMAPCSRQALVRRTGVPCTFARSTRHSMQSVPPPLAHHVPPRAGRVSLGVRSTPWVLASGVHLNAARDSCSAVPWSAPASSSATASFGVGMSSAAPVSHGYAPGRWLPSRSPRSRSARTTVPAPVRHCSGGARWRGSMAVVLCARLLDSCCARSVRKPRSEAQKPGGARQK